MFDQRVITREKTLFFPASLKDLFWVSLTSDLWKSLFIQQ